MSAPRTSTHTPLSAETRAALTAAGLDPDAVVELARRTLAEDLDGGVDVTSAATVPDDQVATADVVARAAGVVAGIPVAAAVFESATSVAPGTTTPSTSDRPHPPVHVEVRTQDGERVARGTVLLSVTGPTRTLLTAERTALNLLCHLSGVATATRAWADALQGTGAVVRDTRKTTPGLRALEKYAVRCGGGRNHRMSLSDAALVKDNHVVAAGGVANAFRAVRTRFPGLDVEVECDTLDQVREAVAAGADLLLLDNMPPPVLREAVALVRGRARLEASGGLTFDTAREVGETGVDYLSVGALTHSAPVLDIGVDLRDAHTLPGRHGSGRDESGDD